MLYFDMPRFTTLQLLARGWTKMLIKRFLPVPDGRIPVDHWKNYSGQNVYLAAKVWNIEHSAEFEAAFLKTWRGRNKGRMKGRDPRQVLTELCKEPHPKAPPWTKEDVKIASRVIEAASLLSQVRATGYRTPHKC